MRSDNESTTADHRITILAVCAVNGHGGPIASVATMMRATQGQVNFALATQANSLSENRSQAEVLASSTIDIPRPRGLGMVQAIMCLLRRRRWIRRSVDLIHANGLTEVVLTLPVALATKTPVLVWVHNSVKPRPYKLAEPLIRVIGRRWAWFAVSSVASELVQSLSPKILLNPVDKTLVARRKGSTGLRVLYFAGTDREVKGFDLLPRIIAASHSLNVTWVIYAGGTAQPREGDRGRVWRALQALGPDRVQLRGRTTDLSQAYGQADLVLAPSRSESFNRVIAEAVSAGLPFLASDIPAHRALAEATGAGLLFPLGDPSRAGKLIDELSNDSRLRETLQAASQKHSEMFDSDVIAERYLSACRRLINKRG